LEDGQAGGEKWASNTPGKLGEEDHVGSKEEVFFKSRSTSRIGVRIDYCIIFGRFLFS
jgi:hypothetical protein